MKKGFRILAGLILLVSFGCAQMPRVLQPTEISTRIMLIDYLTNKIVYATDQLQSPAEVPADDPFKSGISVKYSFGIYEKISPQDRAQRPLENIFEPPSIPKSARLDVLIESTDQKIKINVKEDMIVKSGQINTFSRVVYADKKPYLLLVVLDATRH